MTKQLVILVSLLMTMVGTAFADGPAPTEDVACVLPPEALKLACERAGYDVNIGNAHLLGGNAEASATTPVSSEAPVATASAVASCDCAGLAAEVAEINRRLAGFAAAHKALAKRVKALEARPVGTATATATSSTTLQSSMAALERRQAEFLQQATQGLEARFARIKRVNARQNERLADHDRRFARVKRVNARQDLEIAELGANDAVQDARLDAQYETDQMQNEEISDLRRERKFAEFGIHGGGLILAGWDYDNVSGLLGVDLTLRVGGRWYWYAAPSMLFTGSDRHFGAMFRSGLGVDILGDFDQNGIADSSYATGSIEFGGMMTSNHLNNQFEGKYVTVEPTLGMLFRFPSGFNVGGFIHGGPRADVEGNLAASIGAGLIGGYAFGSRH